MTPWMKQLLVIAIGGGVGAMSRFALSSWVMRLTHHRDFPWGILAVNVLGSLIMGILTAILLERAALDSLWRAGLLIGLLGGFTTFSSFSIDTVTLLQAGNLSGAFLNIALNVICCITAAGAGLYLTRLVF